MIQRILVPLDGSAASAAALRTAIDLAQCARAELVLMNVIPLTRTTTAGPAGAISYVLEEASGAERRRHHELITVAGDQVPEDVAWRHVITSGDPADAILHQLEIGDYDLVVIGSRGRGNIGAAVLGSVSSHVLHRADIPVTIVRATKVDKPWMPSGADSDAAQHSSATADQC